MRKQTKLVAVLSAAALLAVGASMTSFAGWEKDEDGIWHYYDSDDEMVEDEWRKDGSKWFYLDEDGNMATDQWVDDDYYVGEDGSMLKNAWVKTFGEDEEDDPDEGEHWYYFGSNGKKVTDQDKKINGKTYYFNEDGKMYTGWYEENGNAYYLGEEDEGWRAENQWLWLENPGSAYDDDSDDDTKGMQIFDCSDDDNDPCDDEGWYWFGSDGKMYHDGSKKKINGRYYMFNEHGQMLYEWINDNEVRYPQPGSTATPSKATNSNAQLDDQLGSYPSNQAYIDHMLYYNVVEEGDRGNGWYEIDGSEDAGTSGDTDWYYIDDGEPKRADGPWTKTTTPENTGDFATYDDDGPVYVARIKVPSDKMGKVYFAFNEMGQMQDGLQYIAEDDEFYYFEEGTGYPQDGKIADVECDDDSYDFRFETKNGNSGKGITGEKDNYLYYKGRRLEADDDYKFYVVDGQVYLVNNKGKIQKAKSGKVFDDDEMENPFFEGKYVYVETGNDGAVKNIEIKDEKKKDSKTLDSFTPERLIYEQLAKLDEDGTAAAVDENGKTIITSAETEDLLFDAEGEYGEDYVAVPFIQLYDDDVYTTLYEGEVKGEEGKEEYKISVKGNKWLGLNNPNHKYNNQQGSKN